MKPPPSPVTTNFFTFFQDPNYHDDTTLNRRPKIEHSEDTEASETSPFKDILSPILLFNEMNENHFPIDGSFYQWNQMDRTLSRWPPSPNGSDTNVSVGSNQFIGDDDLSKAWWEQCNHPDFPEDEFRRAFRMSKSTFDFICSKLDPILAKKARRLRLATPVRKLVAVCIWHLATGESLRLVSEKFGLGISTCHKLVLEVCSAIKTFLMNKFLNWPDEERMRGVKRDFELVSGIPNVGGSMYTTHVPIIAPKVNGPAYFNNRHTERNQKTSYSITVQGIVDSNGVFTDICIGWPGSMTDDKILEKSALSQRANRKLLKDVLIVGNSGYPLTDWVLVPYFPSKDWCQTVFNEKVGEVQRVAKEAFSRLKGRWSCLQKRTEVKLQDFPVVLGACCVLHNICEMRGEVMDPSETSFDLFDDEMLPKNEPFYMHRSEGTDGATTSSLTPLWAPTDRFEPFFLFKRFTPVPAFRITT